MCMSTHLQLLEVKNATIVFILIRVVVIVRHIPTPQCSSRRTSCRDRHKHIHFGFVMHANTP